MSLIVYLTGFFIEACQDLPGWPAGVLHRRFLGWPHDIPAELWQEKAPTRLIQAEASSLLSIR